MLFNDWLWAGKHVIYKRNLTVQELTEHLVLDMFETQITKIDPDLQHQVTQNIWLKKQIAGHGVVGL